MLGFTVVSRDAHGGVLTRDTVRIGLIRKEDHDPRQAGSMCFAVDGIEPLRTELEVRRREPGRVSNRRMERWEIPRVLPARG